MPPATGLSVFKRWVGSRCGRGWSLPRRSWPFAPQVPPRRRSSSGVSPSAPLTNEQVTFVHLRRRRPTPQTWDFDGDRLLRRRQRARQPSGPSGRPAATGSRLHQRGVQQRHRPRERFTVQNRPPAAAITYAPLAPNSGDSVALASISADPDGPLVARTGISTATGSSMTLGADRIGLLRRRGQPSRRAARDGSRWSRDVTGVTIAVQEPPVHALNPFPVVRIVGSFGTPGIRIEQLVITAPDGARIEIQLPRPRLSVQEAGPQGAAADGARAPFRAADPAPGRSRAGVGRRGPVRSGSTRRLRIRKGKRPTRVDRCLMPGSKQPTRCPS